MDSDRKNVIAARHQVAVGGLCEGPAGMATPERIRDEKLGSYLPMFVGPWEPKMLRRLCLLCRKQGWKLGTDEFISRMTGDFREDYRPLLEETVQVLKEFPDVVYGTSILQEYGGVRFYWPYASVEGAPTCPSPVKDFAAAQDELLAVLRATLERSRKMGFPEPHLTTEARCLAAHFYYRGGMGRVFVEMTYHQDIEMNFAAARGAARAFRIPNFGTNLATLWYGGNTHDELWFKRWQNSLYHAFIQGADPSYAEHGLAGYSNTLGADAAPDAPDVHRFRQVLADFAQFTREHHRPDGYPMAAVAIMQGRYDGYAGMDQTHIWGQRTDEAFRVGYPEASWELVNDLYRRRLWENRDKLGEADYSGNPPLGQVDIIPYDTPDDVLASYKLVILLGRNSMDRPMYERLVRYVSQGGQLLLAAAHLDEAIVPKGDFVPYNGGDWSELCGVRLRSREALTPYGLKFKAEPPCGWRFPLWTSVSDPKYPGAGFRIADLEMVDAQMAAVASDRFNDVDLEARADSGTSSTEAFNGDGEEGGAGVMDAEAQWAGLTTPMVCWKSLGRGCVVLVNSLEYPGHPGLRELYRFLMAAACDANRGYPRVEASDRVRYALYDGTPRVLYILNTEENLEQCAIVHWDEAHCETLRLAPGQLVERLCQ